MDLSYTNLTDCLEDFLGGDHKTHFPILKKLDLKNTKLSGRDISCFCRALGENWIPKLKELDISSNILTNYMGILVTCSTLRSLGVLNLFHSELNKTDFIQVSRSLQKLRSLKHLNLRCNSLTGCLKHMLDVHDPSGPCSLTTLDLTCTGLIKADLGNLLQALNETKISHCTSLYIKKYYDWLHQRIICGHWTSLC